MLVLQVALSRCYCRLPNCVSPERPAWCSVINLSDRLLEFTNVAFTSPQIYTDRRSYNQVQWFTGSQPRKRKSSSSRQTNTNLRYTLQIAAFVISCRGICS